MPYGEALEYQRAVARARISGEIAEDVLLLVEHPPVVTLGRSSKETPSARVAGAPRVARRRAVRGRARRRRHVPRPGAARRLSDHRSQATQAATCTGICARSERRSSKRSASSDRRRAKRRVHRRVDPGTEDRVDRRARARLGHLARLRAQRDDGSELLRSDGPVRDRGGDDDLDRARGGRRPARYIARGGCHDSRHRLGVRSHHEMADSPITRRSSNSRLSRAAARRSIDLP